MLLTPSTELEAVNVLLRAIGEPEVDTLTVDQDEDSEEALETIRTLSRSSQERGWWFNSSTVYLTPQSTAPYEILLTPNVLSVTKADPTDERVVAQRGGKLFDLTNDTFAFDRKVQVKQVVVLPFEDLPSAARNYIVASARVTFKSNIKGADTVSSLEAQAVDNSLARLLDEETEATPTTYNIFQNGSGLSTFRYRMR